MRPALPLSRLEDGRGRQRGRDDLGAARERPRREGEAQGLSGARGRRLRLGLHGPAADNAGVRAAAVRADAGHQGQHREDPRRVQLGADPGRAIDSAHSSSLHSSDMVPARVDERQGRRTRPGCAPRPTGRRAMQSSAPTTASATPRSAGRSRMRPRTTIARSRSIVAPFTALIPPNNMLQRGERQRARWTTQHDVLFHRLERRHEAGVDADTWRKFSTSAMPGIDLDREFRQHAHAREQLSAGPRGHEARRLHRHHRHSQPGHRDVGDDGADRRPLAGAARRERSRRRANSAR